MSTAVFHGSHSVAPRLRLTRRGRVVFTFLVAAPLAVAAFAFALNGGGATATSSSASAHFHYVTVAAGESLWQVATTVAPRADPTDVMADIVALNQLETSSVYPGEELAIPLKYTR